MIINSIEIINTIGEVIGLTALFFTNIIFIRSIMLMSSFIFLITGYFIGLYSMAFWSFFYIIINIIQIIIIKNKDSEKHFDILQKYMFKCLSNFSRNEFLELYKLGTIEHFSPHQLKNANTNHIRFICKGEAINISHKNMAKVINKNHFIGHANLLSKTNKNMQLDNQQPLCCFSWKKTDLLELKNNKSSVFNKLVEALGIDIYTQTT